MNPREKIISAIEHKEPNKLPIDIGGSPNTGIHVSLIYKLRQYYRLDKSNTPVKVIEPYQMIGEIKDDLKEIIGSDVAILLGKNNLFGFENTNWKKWKLHDNTPILVPGLFNTERNSDGSIYQFAKGDKRYPPSGKMTAGGFFFDALVRQKLLDEYELDPNDNIEEFGLLRKDDIDYLKSELEKLRVDNEYAVLGAVASSGFGDIALVPGPMLKDPKGIRDIEEWYVSTNTRRDYMKKVFQGQLEVALENYKKVNEFLGDLIDIVYVSGTDFGTQQGLFISPETYKDLYKPYHRKVNDWIHLNTKWKCFMHCCGAVYDMIPDFIEAGFDILNPVQISASGMIPKKLKKEFGKHLTFWGGGVDTQKVLAFGSPKEVKEQVEEMISIFSPGGGFVFSAVHNIQQNVPLENLITLIDTLNKFRN